MKNGRKNHCYSTQSTTADGSGKESHCLPASRDAEDRVGGSAEVGHDLLYDLLRDQHVAFTIWFTKESVSL